MKRRFSDPGATPKKGNLQLRRVWSIALLGLPLTFGVVDGAYAAGKAVAMNKVGKKGAKKPAPELTVGEVKKRLPIILDDPRIVVGVHQGASGKWFIRLSGTVNTEKEVTGAVKTAERFKTKSITEVVSALLSDAAVPTRTAVKAKIERERLVQSITNALDDPRITVALVPSTGGRYYIRLTGTVNTAGEESGALKTAQLYQARSVTHVVSSMYVKDTAQTREAAKLVTNKPGSTAPGDKAIAIANALNDPRVQVRVFALPIERGGWKYVARLSGTVKDAAEKDSLNAAALAFVPTIVDQVSSEVFVSADAPTRKAALITQVTDDLNGKLQDPRVKVRVVDVSEDPLRTKLIAYLTGSVQTDVEKAAALQRLGTYRSPALARAFETIAIDKDALTLVAAFRPKPLDPVQRVIWPLTFGNEAISTTGDSGSEARYDIAPLTTAINAVFKKKADTDPEVVQAARHSLIIQGPASTVYDVRRMLTQLDAPGPQVQLDLWAVQLSGNGKELADRRKRVEENIRSTQGMMLATQDLLQQAIIRGWAPNSTDQTGFEKKFAKNKVKGLPGPYDPKYYTQGLSEAQIQALPREKRRVIEHLKKLKDIGFDLDPEKRVLTLPEMMVFLSLPDRKTCKDILTYFSDLVYDTFGKDIPGYDEKDPKFLFNTTLIACTAQDTDPNLTPARDSIIDFLSNVQQFRKLDTYEKFVYARDAANQKLPILKEIQIEGGQGLLPVDGVAPGPDPNSPTVESIVRNPERLARSAALVDNMFKILTDALFEDLQQICLRPLLDKLRKEEAARKVGGSGVSATGRTRIVVTSGLLANLTATMNGQVDSTIPAPFDGTALFNAAIPAKAAKGEELAGLARAISGMDQLKAVLAAGAVATPVTKRYTSVAPGITIAVRPTVLANGASARLQIDAGFGVGSTVNEPAENSNTWQPPSANTVTNHQVVTDAMINGLDLFDISEFGVITRHPRGPGYIPVLGRLPLVGPLFQWRRKDTDIQHNSVILVNTVILPRALDIVRYYSE